MKRKLERISNLFSRLPLLATPAVMRSVIKWLLALAFSSLFIEMIFAVSMLIFIGNAKVPRWAEILYGISLFMLILSGILFLISERRLIQNFISDFWDCA